MTSSIPAVVPPLPRDSACNRHYPPSMALDWLAAGWRDLVTDPMPSLLYGLGVFIVSAAIVAGLFAFGLDYILFPAFAGFMVVGPILAIGLYEKSRRIAAGQPVTLAGMIFVRAASGGQLWFTGVLLCLLMLLWMRAAVIIYALFFGLLPFPGLNHVAAVLFTTPTGWALLIVGSVVGALFAAFSFAISVFPCPCCSRARRRPDRDGHQHVAGLEQPAGHAGLGGDRARALRGQPGDRPAGPDRRLSPARPGTWHAYRAIRPRATSCCWQAAGGRRACDRTSSACPPSIAAPASREIERALRDLPEVDRARVNLSTRRVTVAWRGEAPPPCSRR